MDRIRTLILGAAGRDFHNFNVRYRTDETREVVGFTATQIPDIAGRRYPAELAGKLYPAGIAIFDEKDLPTLISDLHVDEVVFSYSDVPYNYVMHRSAVANAAGADFVLLGARSTMLKSRRPVISICAVRTGSGKSQTTRKIAGLLRARGLQVAAVRHPMPYGDLAAQRVQRFDTIADMEKHRCTIEEIEEYEPHIASGSIVFAGVDYEAILREAEEVADVVLWDGGNNDLPFYRPDLHIVVADPLRVGHELTYYPGEANLRMADAIVINKIDSADLASVEQLRANIRGANEHAIVIEAASPVAGDRAQMITGKRVLVIEDGPTATHGEMKFGAGAVLARKFGAREIIDPRPYAVGSIAATFQKYPNIGAVLPAMGYGDQQVKDLQATIAAVPCDVVVVGTPIDLARLITIPVPSVRVRYDLQEIGKPDLEDVIGSFLATHQIVRPQSRVQVPKA